MKTSLTAVLAISLASSVLGKIPQPLAQRMDKVIEKARMRALTSEANTPWVVMHAVVAFERDIEVLDLNKNKKVNAIDYLTASAEFEGQLIYQDREGVPILKTRGRGDKSFLVQDHVDQFLFAYADAGVSLDHEIISRSGRKFSVGDKLNHARKGFREEQELAWTLVALAHYVPFEEQWRADTGKKYDTEEVLRLAIQRDPRRETEGGPHHLYGVAYALRRYLDQGGKLSGTWRKAREYLDVYLAISRKHQQEDGAFSAGGFHRSLRPRTPRHLVSSTGHALEWMSLALTSEELGQDWVVKAIERLVTDMEKFPTEVFSDGGLYHAAHALRRIREATSGN
tara:strand:+ start:29948 stop:30967 length:1020 start_codon:yes stop_codon:yes gene_type:complete